MHNNFIKGIDSKIYREKEMLFYQVDENNYYTSKQQKYISSIIYTKNISDIETILYILLKIANRTNRILILPSFPCNLHTNIYNNINTNKKCNFIKYWYIEELNKYYPNKYREHSFPYNKLVNKKYVKGKILNLENDNINRIIYILHRIDYNYIIINISSIYSHYTNITGVKRKRK